MLAVARGPGPTMQQYGAALASNAVASSSRITLDAPPNAPPDAPPDDDASSPARRPRSRSASAAPKRFVCGYAGCGKAYAKPARLKEHEAVHTGERPHACHDCSATYRRATHLAAHVRTHRPQADKAFVCSYDGCDKRFWTAQHLHRHERAHEVERGYKCEQCDEAFAKHHQLRAHVAARHCPPGTKPFRCTHPGCEWSFETSQKLRVHARTHDGSRYLCSHAAHGDDMPAFATWTDLRAHVAAAHPPTCPYPECRRRTFAKKRNLAEHLRVHREHEDGAVLGAAATTAAAAEPVRLENSKEGSEGDSDDYLPPSRKRRRSASAATSPGDTLKRLRRSRSVSEGVQAFACDVVDCGKSFKTKRALSVHHSTAHLGLRPFACPVTDCGARYGHKHLLQRHTAARHAVELAHPRPLPAHAPEPSTAELLSGMYQLTPAMLAKRPLQCPCDSVAVEAGSEGESIEGEAGKGAAGAETPRCRYRFGRLYDLQRHAKRLHGLELTERELRVLLKQRDQAGKSGIRMAAVVTGSPASARE